jgi:hypothetical protein
VLGLRFHALADDGQTLLREDRVVPDEILLRLFPAPLTLGPPSAEIVSLHAKDWRFNNMARLDVTHRRDQSQ